MNVLTGTGVLGHLLRQERRWTRRRLTLSSLAVRSAKRGSMRPVRSAGEPRPGQVGRGRVPKQGSGGGGRGTKGCPPLRNYSPPPALGTGETHFSSRRGRRNIPLGRVLFGVESSCLRLQGRSPTGLSRPCGTDPVSRVEMGTRLYGP